MNKKKVLVAMSGGVDSSVSAYLLKKSGYEVSGMTLELYPAPQKARRVNPAGHSVPYGVKPWCGVYAKRENYYLENLEVCNGLSSTSEAQKVAAQLKLPHFVLKVEEIFKKKIIAHFCQAYRRGKTPNPCIRCNQYIKFAFLFKKAKELGIEFVATGHYARIEYDKERKIYLLKKGVDTQKEQSYFLYILRQPQLKRILFPLGNYTKDEVRNKAKELGLTLVAKTESQEICFIPGNDYRKFLKESQPEAATPGFILNGQGKILGKHSGIAFYTIGQRKGLGISNREPLYVTSIVPKSNSIIVGEERSLYQKELLAEKVRFIFLKEISEGFSVKAKIRYQHKEKEAKLFPQGGRNFWVKFKEPQRAITPGQAVVFYAGEVVLGGGIIKN